MGDIRARAGRVLMVGFQGDELDAGTGAALRDLAPGGAIVFARNLSSPERLAGLVAALRESMPPPPLLAIDQEGGRVSRLKPWIGATPTAAMLAAVGETAVQRFGAATGGALRALGLNVDFAPVVDLCAPGTANGIGDRSFGTDPARVTALAGAFLDGLQSAGVAGCLKHFPGLGDTAADTHETLPVCERDGTRLLREDVEPFARLVGRAATVMVGHAGYSALDPDPRRPASLSSAIVQGLLRRRLGYRGLVVSDDLEMGAVTAWDRAGSAAVEAVAAGCDLVLYCSDLERAAAARDALCRAAERDPAFATRLTAAAEAVTRTAERWPAPDPDLGAWSAARLGLREAASLA